MELLIQNWALHIGFGCDTPVELVELTGSRRSNYQLI